MLCSARRETSAGPNITLEDLAILNGWHASAINEKLTTASPPKWKSQRQLYREVQHYGPDRRWTRLTPTPTPPLNPPSLVVPPTSPPSRHHREYIPTVSKPITRNRNQKSTATARRSPTKRVEKRNTKHSMVTRSQCRGQCYRRRQAKMGANKYIL
jgi:hypothetical protein